MIEKRKCMRFNVFLDALCRVGNTLKRLKVNDFSREGIGMSSEHHLPEGENVEIEMMIPGDNMPVLIAGEIAWASNPASDNEQCKGGMKFKKMSDFDRGRILEYVYQRWIMPGRTKVKK